MSEVPYSEFEWKTAEAANGESGVGLAQVFINLVAGLMNVKRVCDLGCGNGYITGKIAALGYEVTGVDASETGIEIARRTFPKPTFIRSLIDANLRETAGLDSFDLVISSDMIEHLYRPADLIEAAVSILKIGRAHV